MKKFLIITIIVAAILAIVLFLKIFNTDKIKPTAVGDTKSTDTQEKEEENIFPLSGNGSLNNILAFGKNLECTISYQTTTTAKDTIKGTFFTSNNRMRGDFLMEEMGPDAVSSFIMQKDVMYSWTAVAGQKYGMKVSVEELSSTKKTDDNPEVAEVVPLEATVTYSCKPWTIVDGSIFEPPTDVIFKDYAEAINKGMEYGTIYNDKGGED